MKKAFYPMIVQCRTVHKGNDDHLNHYDDHLNDDDDDDCIVEQCNAEQTTGHGGHMEGSLLSLGALQGSSASRLI